MTPIRKLLDKLRTFKDHSNSLSRRAEVEAVLWNVYMGKRPMLTQEECKALAIKLGVPDAYQKKEK